MDNTHSEYRTIISYENGKVQLDSGLDHYHYGATSSTELLYNGVDIRCEVILLSRNIVIDGADQQSEGEHGAQIFVTDFLEANGVWRKA